MENKRLTLALISANLNITSKHLLNEHLMTPVKNCITKRIQDNNYTATTSKGRTIFDLGKSSTSRIINGLDNVSAIITNTLQTILHEDLVYESHSHSLFNYKTYSFLIEVQESWKQYIYDIDNFKSANEFINDTFNDIDNNYYSLSFTYNNEVINITEKLKSINNSQNHLFDSAEELLTYKLSIITIIAFLCPILEKCSNSNNKSENALKKSLFTLTELIFPKSKSQKVPNNSTTTTPAATDLLYEAKRSINEFNYNVAGQKLTQIIEEHTALASSDILLQTYKLLDICRQNDFRDIPEWLNSYQNIQENASKFNINNFNTHSIIPEVKKSSFHDSGYYYLKCTNEDIKKWLLPTIPVKWIDISALNNETVFSLESFINSSTIKNNNIRFIFAEDNYENNICDALSTLDMLKSSKYYKATSNNRDGNIEIVIRCEQEKVSSILDTACSILYEDLEDDSLYYNPIKIHILDEKKRAADLLYASHPLFYPLTTLKVKQQLQRLKKENKKLNYNLLIISDNPNIDYCIWLIREAFSLLPHINSTVPIESKIMVLSPHAKEITNRTTALCPGFAFRSKNISGDNIIINARQDISITDIQFPEIEYLNIRMDSPDLQNYIEKLAPPHDVSYFIVDSSSDLDAIQIGKQIRETLIRKYVQTKTLVNYSPNSTIIAVKCANPTYINVAQQLIVPKEKEHDNLWFNDYKLITFGSMNKIFSWDELTGGIIEYLSLCMHRQYSTPRGENCNFNKPVPNQTLWSYYNRIYNRDSSYLAAISLPYRLFEANSFLDEWEWSFSDEEALWSKENRKKLAINFSKINDSEKKLLCRWEHNRFCCYLLSRGWLPANSDEVKYYMRNGVQRHTLQIARLHPCLCSWDSLKFDLYDTLHAAYMGPIDAYGKHYDSRKNPIFEDFNDDNTHFQKIDEDNIRQTGDILNANPLLKQRNNEEFLSL